MKKVYIFTFLFVALIFLASCSGNSGVANQQQQTTTSSSGQVETSGSSGTSTGGNVVQTIANLFASGKAIKCSYELNYQDPMSGEQVKTVAEAYFTRDQSKVVMRDTTSGNEVYEIISDKDYVYTRVSSYQTYFKEQGCEWLKIPKSSPEASQEQVADIDLDDTKTLEEIKVEYGKYYEKFSCEPVSVPPNFFQPSGKVCDFSNIMPPNFQQ